MSVHFKEPCFEAKIVHVDNGGPIPTKDPRYRFVRAGYVVLEFLTAGERHRVTIMNDWDGEVPREMRKVGARSIIKLATGKRKRVYDSFDIPLWVWKCQVRPTMAQALKTQERMVV